MASRPIPNQTSVKQVLAVVLLAAFAGCGKESNTRDAVISGGSMAPVLVGEHYQITCADCRFKFKVAPKLPRQKTFVCPNCGYDKNAAPRLVQPADQVSIVEATQFERWEIAAFQRSRSKDASVKRIVGLPGEHIKIQDGDLFVDSKRVQKDIATQKAMRVLVYDASFRSSDRKLPSRWQSETSPSAWELDDSVYPVRFSDEPHRGTLEWLRFQPWRTFHHGNKRTELFPLEDSYAFNQAVTQDLLPVKDLFVEVKLERVTAQEFVIQLMCGGQSFICLFQLSTNTIKLVTPQQEAKSIDAPVSLDGAYQVEITSFDRQYRLLVNGVPVYEESINSDHQESDVQELDAMAKQIDHPVALGASSGQVDIRGVKIYRDIHYRNLGAQNHEGYQLGNGEYFLLGDNVAISKDSRHWEQPAVSEGDFLGKVKLAHE